MMCFQRFYQTRFLVVFLMTNFAQISMKGECLSLDIENELSSFAFREGVTSEIIFHVNNITDNITLYVFKNGHNKDAACKLVLTQTTCEKHSGFCQCLPASKEGQLKFTFRKQFHVQDNGVWVFEVWDTDVKKLVNISVHGNTTENTTEKATDKETTELSTDTSSPQSDVISILIIVIAMVILVIAISAIIVVLCRPSFAIGASFRLFLTTRSLEQRHSDASSAQSSQSSVSHDRCPANEDVSQHDSEDARSFTDGSLKEDVAFDNRKSNDDNVDIIKETTTLPPLHPLSTPARNTTPASAAPPLPRCRSPPPPLLPQRGAARPQQESASEPKPSAPAPPPKPTAALQPPPPPTVLQRKILQISKPSATPAPPLLLGLDPPASESAPAPPPPPAPKTPARLTPPKPRESQPASPAASERKIPQASKSSKTSIPLQSLLGLTPPANESETAQAPKAPAPPPKPPQPEQTSLELPIVQSTAVKLLQLQAPTMKPLDPATRIRAPASPLVPTRTQVNSPEPTGAPRSQQVSLLLSDESAPPLPPDPAPPLAPPTPLKAPVTPVTPVKPFKPPKLPLSPRKAPPPDPPPKPPVARVPPDCKEQWLPLQL